MSEKILPKFVTIFLTNLLNKNHYLHELARF